MTLPSIYTKRFVARIALCLSASLVSWLSAFAEVRSVILMIGDGMGFEHVRAASLYLRGTEGALAMECLPYRASVKTSSASGAVTDSAAAATAFATGRKVANRVLSLAIPGDGSPLTTLVELFKRQGKFTGLVTTDRVTAATPAGFAAHAPDRSALEVIARSMFGEVRPDIIMGAADEADIIAAEHAGYRVERSLVQIGAIGPILVSLASGVMPFRSDVPCGDASRPTLAEMSRAALEFLGRSKAGFFVMIEGARIDHASHNNDLMRTIGEIVDFDEAVEAVIRWASPRRDVLVIVTADHETGGLTVKKASGRGKLPEVSWATKAHTQADVPLFAWGVEAWRFAQKLDNTEVFEHIATVAGLAVEVGTR